MLVIATYLPCSGPRACSLNLTSLCQVPRLLKVEIVEVGGPELDEVQGLVKRQGLG